MNRVSTCGPIFRKGTGVLSAVSAPASGVTEVAEVAGRLTTAWTEGSLPWAIGAAIRRQG